MPNCGEIASAAPRFSDGMCCVYSPSLVPMDKRPQELPPLPESQLGWGGLVMLAIAARWKCVSAYGGK
eukprot:8402353-Pyramimonas_sp.AAC.1